MFDIGWTELMVVGVVALIVIGPKDLPDMFRTMGRFTAKARSMARDFQRAIFCRISAELGGTYVPRSEYPILRRSVDHSRNL